MKVKMRVDVSGAFNGVAWPPRGEVVEVSDEHGVDLCASGIAEPVADAGPVETATAPEAEKRTAPVKSAGGAKPAKDDAVTF